jgi:hypothetical protein
MLLHIKIKEWLRLPEKSTAESVPLAAVIVPLYVDAFNNR